MSGHLQTKRRKTMAVAIDDEIFQDAYLAELKPESEIVLIPKIGGG
jgi:sulfur-carrier protein